MYVLRFIDKPKIGLKKPTTWVRVLTLHIRFQIRPIRATPYDGFFTLIGLFHHAADFSRV